MDLSHNNKLYLCGRWEADGESKEEGLGLKSKMSFRMPQL